MNSRSAKNTEQLSDPLGVTYNADHHDQSIGKAENLKAQFNDGLMSAKDSMVSAKERVFGAPIQPIEGGMPGRYHPHPETVEATVPGSGLKEKVKSGLVSAQTSAQAGLASAQAGLLSAKDRVFGAPIEPVETGMPGRYHPHPETFEAPAPTLLERVKTGAQQGLATTQAGLVSAKNAVFGETIEPIEGGMPGRNHPHPESFETPAPTLMEKVKGGLVSAQTTVQSGLTSAQTGFFEAKKRVWGTKIEPIEGGMPGRNHPHPERFYAQTPSLMEKVKSTWSSVQTTAGTGLSEAKKRVWGAKIEPIEGGMPGRNHPHAERFYAPAPTLMDKMKGGLIWAETSVQAGLVSAKDRVLSLTETVEPVGEMPGRNHPHPEAFEAPAPGIMDKMKGGLTSTQLGLISAKERFFGKPVVPIEGGMPGRNHPHPERFEAKAPGFLTKIGDLVRDHMPFDHKVEMQQKEIQVPSEIEKESIDQDAVKEQLEATLAKETIHPLQGMPGPGRNHPMADSHKAQDQGVINKLSDKFKSVFIGEKTAGSV